MASESYRRMTLEEIAAKIGISRTTIYNVVNRRGSVSQKTRRAVLDALKEYHYIPNQNARDLAMNKRVTVALLDYDSLNAAYFHPAIIRGVERAMSKYGDNGLEVKVFTADRNTPEEQRDFLCLARQQGIQDFVIVAASPPDMKKESGQLRAEGCHVIMLSKPVPDGSYDAFIGIDDYKAGTIAGELMGKMLPEHGTIQMLMGTRSYSSTDSLLARCRGFSDVIRKDYRNLTLLHPIEELNTKGDISLALEHILDFTEIKGIFDLTFHPDIVASYIQEHCTRRPRLICMDLFPELIPYVADGIVDAVIFQDIAKQAETACEALFRLECYGEEILPGNHDSRLAIVMKSNLSCYT